MDTLSFLRITYNTNIYIYYILYNIIYNIYRKFSIYITTISMMIEICIKELRAWNEWLRVGVGEKVGQRGVSPDPRRKIGLPFSPRIEYDFE